MSKDIQVSSHITECSGGYCPSYNSSIFHGAQFNTTKTFVTAHKPSMTRYKHGAYSRTMVSTSTGETLLKPATIYESLEPMFNIDIELVLCYMMHSRLVLDVSETQNPTSNKTLVGWTFRHNIMHLLWRVKCLPSLL